MKSTFVAVAFALVCGNTLAFAPPSATVSKELHTKRIVGRKTDLFMSENGVSFWE
jgi:hypothetical protein